MTAEQISNLPESNTQPARKYFSRKEAADYLGVSTLTIDRAIKSKKLSCAYIGRRVILTPAQCDEFFERNVRAAKK